MDWLKLFPLFDGDACLPDNGAKRANRQIAA